MKLARKIINENLVDLVEPDSDIWTSQALLVYETLPTSQWPTIELEDLVELIRGIPGLILDPEDLAIYVLEEIRGPIY